MKNIFKTALFVLVLLIKAVLPAEVAAQAPAEVRPTSEIRVHDPVMIRQDGTYYLFSTGRGIAFFSSDDMKNWKRQEPVFATPPEWAVETVPGYEGHTWAPDIAFHDGKYYLYYSVSSFGKNTSAIGVATNTTLNPDDPDYKWVDHGKVLQSVPGRDDWNAIDPNLAFDKDGQPWLTFGSFWGGIKLVKMDKDLKKVAQPEHWYTIAARPYGNPEIQGGENGQNAIEAPFIFKKDDYYYLFVSFDYCCKGEKSTYKMVVGRSKEFIGPYMDKEGEYMVRGGGTLILEGDKNWHGVGHNSVYNFDGTDYLVFHGYDAADEGKPKLRIEELKWTPDGWPVVKAIAADSNASEDSNNKTKRKSKNNKN